MTRYHGWLCICLEIGWSEWVNLTMFWVWIWCLRLWFMMVNMWLMDITKIGLVYVSVDDWMWLCLNDRECMLIERGETVIERWYVTEGESNFALISFCIMIDSLDIWMKWIYLCDMMVVICALLVDTCYTLLICMHGWLWLFDNVTIAWLC